MKPHSFLLLMQVKRGRIPKKNTGRYAGFGFIEFGTKQEALNAKRHYPAPISMDAVW